MNVKNHSKHKLFHKNNFTILELLIVIAIIAVLATMLLPALNKARNKAKNIKCMNSLKTIGKYFMFYSLDYDGLLPNYSNQNKTKYWFAIRSNGYLYPYLSPGIKNTQNGAFSIGTVGEADKSMQGRSLLSCPSFIYIGKGKYDLRYSYGLTWKIGYVNGSPNSDCYYRITQASTPSNISLIEEIDDSLPRVSNNEAYRHSSGNFTNQLFLDFHVQSTLRQ